MRSLLRIAAGVAVAAYAVLLAVNNGALVTVDLLFGQVEDVPAWALILGSLALGALAAAAALSWPLLRLRMRVRRSAQRVAALEQELHGLRTLPLGDEEETRAAAPGE